MNLPSKQRGLSALSILVIILVAVFFGTCVIKLTPHYLNYQTIKADVETVVEEAQQRNMSKSEMKSKIGKLFQVDMVDAITVRDVHIKQKDGKFIIDARYEKRVPLMFNIDVVLKFDQLQYEFVSK